MIAWLFTGVPQSFAIHPFLLHHNYMFKFIYFMRNFAHEKFLRRLPDLYQPPSFMCFLLYRCIFKYNCEWNHLSSLWIALHWTRYSHRSPCPPKLPTIIFWFCLHPENSLLPGQSRAFQFSNDPYLFWYWLSLLRSKYCWNIYRFHLCLV